MKSIFKYVITAPLAATIGMSPIVPTLSAVAKSNNQNGYSNLLTVTFEPKDPTDPEEVLTGPRTVKVKRNWRLYMINKPTATKAGKSLLGWAYKPASGEEYPTLPLAENTKVTTDVTLVPVYTPDYLDKVCVMVEGQLKALDINSLCNEESKINYEDGSSFCDRSELNQDIYIGKGITTIPNFFLTGCSNFEAQVHFEESNSLIYIGSSFMNGCTAFNQKLELNKCTNLIAIGNGFMKGCYSFNNGTDEETTNPFTFPNKLINIGSEFFYSCETFNSPIVFSNENKIQTIGKDFLTNCGTFKQTIDFRPISETLVAGGIEDPIMRNLNEFGDDDPEKAPKILIPDGFESKFNYEEGKTLSFTTDDRDASCYQNGIHLESEGEVESFKAVFPSKFSSPYRRWSDDLLPQSVDFVNITQEANAIVKLNVTTEDPETYSPNLEYTLDDGETWQPLEPGTPIQLQGGQTIKIHGVNPNGLSLDSNNYCNIAITSEDPDNKAQVTVSGNLLDLSNYTDRPTGTVPYYGHLFAGSDAITNVESESVFDFGEMTYSEDYQSFEYLFAGCSNLNDAKFPKNLTVVHKGMYQGTAVDNDVVPSEEGDPGWDSIEKIDDFAFAGCTNMNYYPKHLHLGETKQVTIGRGAFYGCTLIQHIILGSNYEGTLYVEKIGQYAFSGCDSVTDISVEALGDIDPTAEDSPTKDWAANAFASMGSSEVVNTFTVDKNTSEENLAKWKIKAEYWGLTLGDQPGQWQVVRAS